MSQSRGWIAAWRRLFDPDYDFIQTNDPACKRFAWLDLVVQAEWREDADLGRGEIQASTEYLRRRWNWPSKDKVYRFLRRLRRDDRIEKTRSGGPNESAIYRIVNYDQYQFHPERGIERTSERGIERGTPGDVREDGPGPNAEQNAHQNADQNEYEENIKKGEQEELFTGDPSDRLPPKDDLPKEGGRYVYPAEFEAFWTVYPDRRGSNSKVGAYRKWRSTVLDGVDPELLYQAASTYRDHLERDGKIGTSYVMQAKTFLGPDEHWRQAWDNQPESASEANQRIRSAYQRRVAKARAVD